MIQYQQAHFNNVGYFISFSYEHQIQILDQIVEME